MHDARFAYSRRISGLNFEQGMLITDELKSTLERELNRVKVRLITSPSSSHTSVDLNPLVSKETVFVLFSEERGEMAVYTGEEENLTTKLIRETCEDILEPLEKALGSDELAQKYFNDLRLKHEARLPQKPVFMT